MWLATRQRIEGSADVNVDVSRGAHSFRPTRKGYITDCRTSCYRAGMPAGMGGECDTPRARHPCTSISGLRWVKGSLRQGFALPLTQLPALYTPFTGRFANPTLQKVLDKLLLIEGSPRFLGSPSHTFALLSDPGRSGWPRLDGQLSAAPTYWNMRTPALK